jgi:hypothetical protein
VHVDAPHRTPVGVDQPGDEWSLERLAGWNGLSVAAHTLESHRWSRGGRRVGSTRDNRDAGNQQADPGGTVSERE